MTFGVSRDHGLFEWSGTAEGIFAQKENMWRPRFWRMIFDIIRFNQFAVDLLVDDDQTMSGPRSEQSIGDYLKLEGYSEAFKDDYLIPMTAAVWSTSPDKTSLEFPVLTLVRFMWNHHLLSTFAARPTWLTIQGGSQRYIDAIVESSDPTRHHFRTESPVVQISRKEKLGIFSVDLTYKSHVDGPEKTETFDHVIMACHGDNILPLMASGTEIPLSEEEHAIFAAFKTSENVAYLHSDLSLMPKRRPVWTAWNYLTQSTPSKLSHPAGVSLTYWMNLLQHLPEDEFGPVLVTLNPPHAPDEDLTQGEYRYRHPLYTIDAVEAQKKLQGIQNASGVSYCGAWTKYGFHEDGFSSGLKVAIDHLGAELPFTFKDSTYSRGMSPALGMKDHVVRMLIRITHNLIVLVEVIFAVPGVALMGNLMLWVLHLFVGLVGKREKIE